MRFKGTLLLSILLAGLGAYVYFYEIKGKEKREKAEREERKLVNVEKEKIRELRLVYPDKLIVGAKEGEDWKVISPLQTTGDSNEWDRVASTFSSLEREQVLEPNPKNLKEYGLDPPALKVSAKYDGSQTPEVLFGNENPTGSYVYAKRSDKPEVVLVPSYAFNSLKRDLNDLRERSVLKFREFDVEEITLINSHGEFNLIKVEGNWRLRKPIEARAEGGQVSSLLNALSFTKVKEFLDQSPPSFSEAGLDRPAIDVILYEGKEKKKRRFMVGKAKVEAKGEKATDGDKKGAPEAYYAKDEGRKEIFLVEKELIDKLNKALIDLRDKSIVKFSRWDVDGIEIERQGQKVALKKEKDEWRLADGKKAQRERIDGIFNALEDNKAKEFIDDPEALARYGLDKPEIVVTLKKEGKKTAQFAIGKTFERKKGKESERLCYLKVEGEKEIKLVDSSVAEKFRVSYKDLAEPGDKK